MKKKKFNIGIIGCGTIADVHADAIKTSEAGNLFSAFSRNEENLNKFCSNYKTAGYKDWDKFIQNPELDIVSICTPNGTHLDYGKQAARAGKHVIVEKPIEINLERGKELIEICRLSNVKLGVIYQSRFLDTAIRMKTTLKNGEIGNIFMANAYIKWFRSQEYYDSAAWRGTLNLDGGGVLINQAIHTIDLLYWFLGDVKSVSAYKGTYTHERLEGEDNLVAALKFQTGALGAIEASTSVIPANKRRIDIYGDKGTAVLDGNSFKLFAGENKPEDTDSENSNTGGSSPLAGFTSELHRKQFDSIMKSIVEGTEPVVSGWESLKSLAIVRAIYESADKSIPIELEKYIKQHLDSE